MDSDAVVVHRPARISARSAKKSDSRLNTVQPLSSADVREFDMSPAASQPGSPDASPRRDSEAARFKEVKPQGNESLHCNAEKHNGYVLHAPGEVKFSDEASGKTRAWQRSWLSGSSDEEEQLPQERPVTVDSNTGLGNTKKREKEGPREQTNHSRKLLSSKRSKGYLGGLMAERPESRRRSSEASAGSRATFGSRGSSRGRSLKNKKCSDEQGGPGCPPKQEKAANASVPMDKSEASRDDVLGSGLHTEKDKPASDISFQAYLHQQLADLEERLVQQHKSHLAATSGVARSTLPAESPSEPAVSAAAKTTAGPKTPSRLVDLLQSASFKLTRGMRSSSKKPLELHEWWVPDPEPEAAVAPAPTARQTGKRTTRQTRTSIFFGARKSFRPSQQAHAQECIEDEAEMSSEIDPWSCLIISPNSGCRLAWDIFGTLLLLYDSIVIPLSAYDVPESDVLSYMEYLTLIFWTLDIPASFLVGYIDDGTVVRNPIKIAERYLRTYFLFDVLITGSTWLITWILESSVGNNVQVFRLLRFARTFRLLRLLKLQRLMGLVHERVNSAYTSIAVSFLKLMLAVLMLSHFAASVWFAIGWYGPVAKNWLDTSELKSERFTMQYVVCLRLVLSTFLFEGVVDPENELENIFLTSLILFGLVVFSYILSKITSLMVELEHMNADVNRELWKLRRFCQQRQVSPQLKFRIIRYLENACEEKRNEIQESDIQILKLLTKDLTNQLRYASHGEMFKAHPLFATISRRFNVTLHRICGTALDERSLAMQDPLFFAGELAAGWFLVMRGSVSYYQISGDSKDKCRRGLAAAMSRPGGHVVRLGNSPGDSKDGLSEAAIWCSAWHHRGDAFAEQDCLIVCVNAAKLGGVILDSPSPVVKRMSSAYGEEFVRLMNEKQQVGASLSDIADGMVVEGAMDVAGMHVARMSALGPQHLRSE